MDLVVIRSFLSMVVDIPVDHPHRSFLFRLEREGGVHSSCRRMNSLALERLGVCGSVYSRSG
jgi:hypothetical protein